MSGGLIAYVNAFEDATPRTTASQSAFADEKPIGQLTNAAYQTKKIERGQLGAERSTKYLRAFPSVAVVATRMLSDELITNLGL